MTPEENQALQTLLSQLTQIRGVVKDPQADAMIVNALSRQPDAAYLLVQRVMILEQAVEAAKARISDLERELQQSRPQAGSGSFLDANSWGNAGAGMGRTERSVTGAEIPSNPSGRPYPTNMPPNTPNMAPNAQNAAPPYSGAPYAAPRPGLFGGGAGSMLGTMAATAAGVAGGAFLYQGLGNLLGNHPGHGMAGRGDAPANLAGDIPPQNAAAFDDLGPSSDAPIDNTAAEDAPADDIAADDGTQDDLLSDNDFDDGSLGDDGSYDV
jgi:uncharacterized protein